MNIRPLAFIDWILHQLFSTWARARDVQPINAAAEQLNKEALDIIDYQFDEN